MSKTVTLAAFLCIYISGFSQAGLLNPGFNNGFVTTTMGTGSSQALDLAVQPDGKVLAVGIAFVNGISNFAVARYNVNGTLDNSFGIAGKVFVNMSPGGCKLNAVAVQPDGKIIAGGSITYNGSSHLSLIRFLTSGTVDPTFGTNGVYSLPMGSNASVKDIALLADGRIVAGGETYINGDYDFFVMRFHSNGTLDLSFAGGYTVLDLDYDEYLRSIAVSPDGRIVIGGTTSATPGSTSSAFVAARFNSNGFPDLSFGNNGKVVTTVGTWDGGNCMALQTDGKIILGGESLVAGQTDMVLLRYTSSGQRDVTWGINGLVVYDIENRDDKAFGISVQSDGRVIVAGHSSQGAQSEAALVRFAADGTVDPSFGSAGYTLTPVGNETRVFAMQASGLNIYLAGTSDGIPAQFAVIAYTNTSSILPVTMTDFRAEKAQEGVRLEWITQNEQEAKSFVVERSSDGNTFKSFDEVAASGNSSTTKRYLTTDRQPFTPITYYRIKTVDFNGAFHFSKILAVKWDVLTASVFPNPVRSAAQLQLPGGLQGNVRIDLLDASGRLTRTTTVEMRGFAMSVPLDMANFAKGVYVLSVSGKDFSYSQKLIKE